MRMRQSCVNFVAAKALDVMMESRAGEWHYAVPSLLLDISDRGNRDKTVLVHCKHSSGYIGIGF